MVFQAVAEYTAQTKQEGPAQNLKVLIQPSNLPRAEPIAWTLTRSDALKTLSSKVGELFAGLLISMLCS